MNKRGKKLSRSESTAIARAAIAVPKDMVSRQFQVRLPQSALTEFQEMNSANRGFYWQIGRTIESGGYLYLYRIIDALGGGIVHTNFGDNISIITRLKTYTGNNHFEVLSRIIDDLIAGKAEITQ